MALNFRKFTDGLNIVPKLTSTVSAQGDIDVTSGNGKLNYFDGTISSPFVTEAGTATLTNKSIDASANTLTNISNSAISASAAISFSKLAALTSGNLLVGNGSNIATSVPLSGDASLSNAGALTVNTVGGASSASIASAASGVSNATSSNTPSTLVLRDGSGNFAAGTITASLSGNATTATSVSGVVPADHGGTGIANNVASTLTISGSFATTFTISNTTSLTLPTSGTLSTLAGIETLTNKTISGSSNTLSNIANASLSNMAAHTIKGNNTGSPAAPSDLTATQVTAELNQFVGDSGSGGLKGLVTAPVTGDATKFLKGDGTWSTITVTGMPGTNWDTSLTFTPSASFGTVTGSQVFSRRVGDSLEVRGYWVNGTVTASAAQLVLPASHTVDYTKIATGGAFSIVGQWNAQTSSGSPDVYYTSGHAGSIFVDSGAGSDRVLFSVQASNSKFVNDTAASISGTSYGFTFQFLIPLTEFAF